ncbi:unnamed protein product [Cladocopium goreaui]|uniref:Uncharacterized protein n=1 Tax=Cladocopium goreaui TaxID=2562237 RepID=A0A9P1DLM9_9DINO|nr:unnamed protein product [Cladocopium goreaui]
MLARFGTKATVRYRCALRGDPRDVPYSMGEVKAQECEWYFEGAAAPWMLHDPESRSLLAFDIDGSKQQNMGKAWPLMEVGIGWSNLVGVIAVLVVLHVGFRFKWKLDTFLEHIDVVCLILLATSGAIVTEVIDYEAWLGSFWAPKEPSQVADAVQ